MTEILLATHNQNKVIEIQQIFSGESVSFSSLANFKNAPHIHEDGHSFLENAVKKATTIASWSGKISLADDSGLEVDCLNGAPGIYSARYAGEEATDQENNLKLLEMLKDIPPDQRTAQYRCVMVIGFPNGRYESAEGHCHGLISLEPHGKNGFGYDPLFYDAVLKKTFAEMDPSIKNKISHRFHALENLKPIILKLLGSF